jgi:hypothetical protein
MTLVEAIESDAKLKRAIGYFMAKEHAKLYSFRVPALMSKDEHAESYLDPL